MGSAPAVLNRRLQRASSVHSFPLVHIYNHAATPLVCTAGVVLPDETRLLLWALDQQSSAPSPLQRIQYMHLSIVHIEAAS